MGAEGTRPDLEQTAWSRAKTDSRLLSLSTFVGAVVLAAFGAAGGQAASSLDPNVAVVALGSAVGFLVGLALLTGYALLRAARNQRDELRGYLKGQDEYRATVEWFRSECFAWADDVDRLLASQEAKEPPKPAIDLYTHLREGPPKEPSDVVEARNRIRRETVSLFIERYRDSGLKKFDALIQLRKIVPDNRQKIERPKSPNDVFAAADSMRTAAERL
jgi:hypothetical protein